LPPALVTLFCPQRLGLGSPELAQAAGQGLSPTCPLAGPDTRCPPCPHRGRQPGLRAPWLHFTGKESAAPSLPQGPVGCLQPPPCQAVPAPAWHCLQPISSEEFDVAFLSMWPRYLILGLHLRSGTAPAPPCQALRSHFRGDRGGTKALGGWG